MAEAFKDLFNKAFFDTFAGDLQLVIAGVDSCEMERRAVTDDWQNKAYKQRVTHLATVLHSFLPQDYGEGIGKVLQMLDKVKERLPDFSQIDDKNFQLLSLAYGAVLDSYVAQYGLDDYDTSVAAIERITQFTTCEFCVRPFIIKYPERMMQQMLLWSAHHHWGVRRLASEGCRPRLPWGMALTNLKQDPTPILPILERLKNDPSRFVRLSVANNLNDIVKDHPETVLDLAKRWKGQSKEVDWILKHGCRTLLKQGNAAAMQLFGFDATARHIAVDGFELASDRVAVGDVLTFRFQLQNHNDHQSLLRLEYAIYYQKANGTLAKKTHKISEKIYEAHSTTAIERKHSFRIVTTRKFHLGLHQVAVVINGKEYEKHDFELVQQG